MRLARWHFIFLAFVLLSVLKHAWLARYCHPMGDDWAYARAGMDHDLLPWSKGEYLHWNGRYFSNILVARGPLVLGLDHLWLYRLIPPVLMLLSLWACWTVVRMFTRGSLSAGSQFAGGLLLFALFIHGMPDIGEGFYWYTGAVTYQFGNVLTFLYVASLATLLGGRSPLPPWSHTLLNALLLVMVIGSDEVHMAMMVVFHAVLLGVRWRMGIRLRPAERILAIVAALCAVVVIAAPGNSVRGSNFPGQHQLLHSLWWSLLQTARFGTTWLSDISLVLLSFLYLPVSRDLSRREPWFQRSFHLSPYMSALLLVGTIFVCVFPAYWSTGILGQHRTVNVAYFFFLPLWFINLTVWDNYLMNGRWYLVIPRRWMAVALCSALLHLHLARNGGRATMDLFTGRARHFSEQMAARYAILEEARDYPPGRAIVVPLIKEPARSLYLLELRPDSSDWVNRDYRRYFGLHRSVIGERR